MSENTLCDMIEILTKKHKLTNYQVFQLKSQLKHWKKDTIVYPGIFKSKLNIDIYQAYNILETFLSSDILERNYEIYCKNCHKFKGTIIRSLSEYKTDLYCDFCNIELNPLEDSIVIYRFIVNE